MGKSPESRVIGNEQESEDPGFRSFAEGRSIDRIGLLLLLHHEEDALGKSRCLEG